MSRSKPLRMYPRPIRTNKYAKAAYSAWWVSKRSSEARHASTAISNVSTDAHALVADAQALAGPFDWASDRKIRFLLSEIAHHSLLASHAEDDACSASARASAAARPRDDSVDPAVANGQASSEHSLAEAAADVARRHRNAGFRAAARLGDVLLTLLDPVDSLAGPLRERALDLVALRTQMQRPYVQRD